MGLLDGDGLRNVFGAAFGGVYQCGTLYRSKRVTATDGKVTQTFSVGIDIKVQFDDVTESMRSFGGYTDRDVRMLVLQSGIGAAPTTDDQISVTNQRWAVAGVSSDPARSHWIIRGTPA